MEHNKSGLLLIGSVSLSTDNPPDRIGGSYFEDVKAKLNAILGIAKEKCLVPVFVGELTAKPFEIEVLDYLVSALIDTQAVILSDSKKLSPGTTLHVLMSSRVADFLSVDKPCKEITLDGVSHELLFALGSDELPSLMVRQASTTKLLASSQPFHQSSPAGETSVYPVVRTRFAMRDQPLSVIEWACSGQQIAHHLNAAEKAFSQPESVNVESIDSNFATMLKEETERAANGKNHELITGEITKIFSSLGCSELTQSTVNALYDEAKTPTLDDLFEDIEDA